MFERLTIVEAERAIARRQLELEVEDLMKELDKKESEAEELRNKKINQKN